ncbi:MAG: hypothetical protein J6S29_03805 [Methanosphaera sp.]|nr:hypothetical protein [Methanosphaera sp.]
MSRILKILLFIIAILAFFEIGLFVSYTVIASEPVNPVDIISMQIDQGSRFINSLTGEKDLNQQDTLNITNKEDVALILNNQTGLSVNLGSLTAKVSTSKAGNQTVTITAIASKDSQSTGGGAIVILPEQTYSISAIATGEVYTNGKVKINTTTIELKEKIVLYNQNSTSTPKNQSIESLVNYTNNLTDNTTRSNQSNNSQ